MSEGEGERGEERREWGGEEGEIGVPFYSYKGNCPLTKKTHQLRSEIKELLGKNGATVFHYRFALS